MSVRQNLIRHRLEDALSQVRITYVGNFTAILFVSGLKYESVFSNPYSQICLAFGIAFVLLHHVYKWTSTTANIVIIALYSALFVIEIITLGVPDSMVPMAKGYSRGMLLDFFFALVPWVYVGLKAVIVIPLVYLTYFQWRHPVRE